MANIELESKKIKNQFIYGYFEQLKDAIIARKKAEEKYYKPILEKYSYNKIIEESEEEFE